MLENHNLTHLGDASFESLIKNDFGLNITNAEKIARGYSNQVYKANLGEELIFIRSNKLAKIFDAEIVGYKIFKSQGIPTPEIIAYKENPPSIGYPTMIMSSAHGTLLKDTIVSPEQNKVIYENMGELVKKINETKLDGYGSLKTENGKLVGEFSTWKDYCILQNEHNSRNLEFCIENNFVTKEDATKIEEINEEISTLDFGKASLIHRDIHKNHVFIEGDKITGIIDLGALTASDPRYEIAYCHIFQNKEERESFNKGYGELTNDPMVNKYMINILIRKIFFRSREEIKGNVATLIPILREALDKIK